MSAYPNLRLLTVIVAMAGFPFPPPGGTAIIAQFVNTFFAQQTQQIRNQTHSKPYGHYARSKSPKNDFRFLFLESRKFPFRYFWKFHNFGLLDYS